MKYYISFILIFMSIETQAGTFTGRNGKNAWTLFKKAGYTTDVVYGVEVLRISNIVTCAVQNQSFKCMTWDPQTSISSHELTGDEAHALFNEMALARVCWAGDSNNYSYSIRDVLCTNLEDQSVQCTFEAGTMTPVWKKCD